MAARAGPEGERRRPPHFPRVRAGRQCGQRAPCCSSCLVLLLAMWLGCIWLRTMIFLTLQRSWKILRRMWKPRRNLLMTSPERATFPRSTLCVYQGCNLSFRQRRSSRGLAWEVPPLLVS